MNKKTILLLRDIIDSVSTRLPRENTDCARELVDHGEWGEALSLICTQLFEYDIPVPASVLENINAVGSAMRMDSKEWDGLVVETEVTKTDNREWEVLVSQNKGMEIPGEYMDRKAQGATANEVASELLSGGYGKLRAVIILRRLYGLTLQEANAVLKTE